MSKHSPTNKKIPIKEKVTKKTGFVMVPETKWYLLGLIFICFVFYGNTLSNGYCLDDVMMITENSSTQKGFSGIKEHLSQDLLFGYKHMKSKSAASSGWRPLSLITFSLEVGFFGKNNPGISHFINVLLYALLVVSVFILFYKYLLKNISISFLIAFLFAIHPIHTEVVANIKSRDEILCFLFVVLSLIKLLRYISLGGNNNLIYSLLFFFLSLLSKESSVTFIAGIPVVLYFFTSLDRKKIFQYTAGFFTVAIVYVLCRNSVVPMFGFTSNPDIINNAFINATGMQAFSTKLLVMFMYLRLLFFPNPLVYDYSYNQIPYTDMSNPLVWISIIIFLGLIFFAVKSFRQKNIFSFIILMFLITFSISTNLFIEIGTIMAERLMFIPSLFFCMGIIYAGKKLIDLISDPDSYRETKSKKIVLTSVFILPVIIASAYQTITRNSDWKDQDTLTLRDLPKSPNSARINNGAGAAYLSFAFATNDKIQKDSLVKISLPYLLKSIELYPRYDDAVVNAGVAYSLLENPDKAEEYLKIVRERNPKHPKLKYLDNYYANKFLTAGIKWSQESKFDSALVNFNNAVIHSNTDSLKLVCWYNIGGLYFTVSNFKKANEAFANVLAIDSNYLNARAGYNESLRIVK